MKKFISVAFACLTFNAVADEISFRNPTSEPLYMAVKQDGSEDYAANSQIGWISNGKVGRMSSNDVFLTNMGIDKGDSYTLGYFDGMTNTYGFCAEVLSGTNRAFEYKNGECVEIIDTDEVRLNNESGDFAYIAVKGGNVYPDAFVIDNDAGWITTGHGYSLTAASSWLANTMGIQKGETYAVAFQTALNEVIVCADDVVSGSKRTFELKNGECTEI